jgi:hypothetical protein
LDFYAVRVESKCAYDLKFVLTRGGSRIGTVELQHPYFHLILSITFNIMSTFFFNSFFILVQYIILKFNVSSHPPVYGINTKIQRHRAWLLCACAYRK